MSDNAPTRAPLSESARLLKLAGGCEHDYYPTDTALELTLRDGTVRYTQFFGCRMCDVSGLIPDWHIGNSPHPPSLQMQRSPDGVVSQVFPEQRLPRVGDGRPLDFGGMVRLWFKLRPDGAIEIDPHMVQVRWPAGRALGHIVWDYQTARYDVPAQTEAALRAAILAAVGERG